MTNINTAFTRSILRTVLDDVRQYQPGIKVSDAWVYRVGRDHWEFHFGKFYWHGSADDAYEARASGWSKWLRQEGIEGYCHPLEGDGK